MDSWYLTRYHIDSCISHKNWNWNAIDAFLIQFARCKRNSITSALHISILPRLRKNYCCSITRPVLKCVNLQNLLFFHIIHGVSENLLIETFEPRKGLNRKTWTCPVMVETRSWALPCIRNWDTKSGFCSKYTRTCSSQHPFRKRRLPCTPCWKPIIHPTMSHDPILP